MSQNPHHKSDIFKIRFGDVIDEYCELADLELPNAGLVEVDFRNVQLVNSLGVRNLFKFFRKLGRKQDVVFRNCSVSFIHQVKLFPSLLTVTNSEIHSFAVPFCCHHCSVTKDVFVKLTTDLAVPRITCKDCGAAMEIQEEKDEYFSFLKVA